MGRSWWYDSYWEKDRKPTRRRFQLPRRRPWVWIALIILSFVLSASNTSFHAVGIMWFLGFVYYFCRILTFAIFIRAILSWFVISRYNLLIILLDDITEPILSPLRRIIPRLGMFDITPLVAIGILYLVPFILNHLLT